MEHPIALQAIQSGKIDVTDVYTTDPEVDLFQLTLLQDDRHFFPPYEAVLLYRLSLAQPVIDTLHSLENTISTPQMRQMNLAVKNKSSTEKRWLSHLCKNIFNGRTTSIFCRNGNNSCAICSSIFY